MTPNTAAADTGLPEGILLMTKPQVMTVNEMLESVEFSNKRVDALLEWKREAVDALRVARKNVVQFRGNPVITQLDEVLAKAEALP